MLRGRKIVSIAVARVFLTDTITRMLMKNLETDIAGVDLHRTHRSQITTTTPITLITTAIPQALAPALRTLIQRPGKGEATIQQARANTFLLMRRSPRCVVLTQRHISSPEHRVLRKDSNHLCPLCSRRM